MRTKQLPRGIRNNNPLNIRVGNCWFGEVKNPTDNEFEQFVSMECGIRAAFVILRRYIQRYKIVKLKDIIARWAPATENNVQAYCFAVCHDSFLTDDHVFSYSSKDDMCELVYRMIKVECGVFVEMTVIQKAYDLA